MASKDISSMRITVVENGPYVVEGSVPLKEEIIEQEEHHKVLTEGKTYPEQAAYTLCRCGKTKTPPFCDGAHVHESFEGTETASRDRYRDRAQVFEGEHLTLYDDNRCAFARLCHRQDGDVWSLTKTADTEHLKEEAIQASSLCPAGRLEHVDKTDDTTAEPELEPSISILQDPEKGVSSGIFVRGGITLVAADGEEYEKRNRYMLCRCGESRNKPFCDASHVPAKFKDQ